MIDLTVARRYAKALLTLGKEDGKYKEYGEELASFAQFLEREPQLRDALLNPIHGREDRKKLLLGLIDLLKMSLLMSNFLQLLFDKQRLGAAAGISQVYQGQMDALENISRAQVKAAIPLDEATQERLCRTLEKLTKSKVIMEVEEDPTIIGGVVARVGDLVLDGSVRTQLASLSESLRKGEVL